MQKIFIFNPFLYFSDYLLYFFRNLPPKKKIPSIRQKTSNPTLQAVCAWAKARATTCNALV